MGNIIFECFFRLFFEGLFEFLFNKYSKLSWGLWCAFSLLFGFYFFAFLNMDKSAWVICLLLERNKVVKRVSHVPRKAAIV